MSPKFNKVKGYYERGLWTKRQVLNAVAHGWITENEYAVITGEETNG